MAQPIAPAPTMTTSAISAFVPTPLYNTFPIITPGLSLDQYECRHEYFTVVRLSAGGLLGFG